MNILNNTISYKKTKPKWKYKVFLNFEIENYLIFIGVSKKFKSRL